MLAALNAGLIIPAGIVVAGVLLIGYWGHRWSAPSGANPTNLQGGGGVTAERVHYRIVSDPASIQPEARAVRITSIADQLRDLKKQLGDLQLEESEEATLLEALGLADTKADAQVLVAVQALSARVDAGLTDGSAALTTLSEKIDVLSAVAEADFRDIVARIDVGVQQILDALFGPPASPAVSARLIVVDNQGEQVPGTITVDTVGEAASLQFIDDKGDTDAAPPTAADGSAAVITFTSSDPAVLTVDDSGAITVVGEGTALLSCNIEDATGAPILEPDGVTPFTPDPVSLTVMAGAAVGARLAVNP